jgi:hypothetical protein
MSVAVSARSDLRWEVMQEYGEEEPALNDPSGGGSFANIAGMKALADGRIAVLDSKFTKVALFAADGRFVRTIGRGRGSGPGEFQLPTAIDVSDSRVFVFDYQLSRVTAFDTTGRLLWTRSTPRAKQIVVVGDTVYGTYMVSKTFMVWRQPTDALQSVTRLIPVDSRLLAVHSPRGAVAMLGRGRDGDILVAHPRPGSWFIINRAGVSPARGTDILGNASFMTFGDMIVTPGDAWGIVALSERHVGVSFLTSRQSGGEQPKLASMEFAVLDRESGNLLGRLPMPGGQSALPLIAPGIRPNEVLVALVDPFPRVARVVLRGL